MKNLCVWYKISENMSFVQNFIQLPCSFLLCILTSLHQMKTNIYFFGNLKLIIFLSFSLLPQRPGCVPSLSQIPSFCYLIYLLQFACLQLDKRTSFMSWLIYFKLIFTRKLSHTFLLNRKGEIKNQNSGLGINLFPIS